jgi:hypothetical protein
MKNPSELVAYLLLHFFFHNNPILGVCDIIAGPSGREVISLQKADSLVVFLNVTRS